MTQEEKSNQEIKPNNEEKSMPMQDDYSMVEQQVQNMQFAKSEQQQYAPENPIDTAHLLLENSNTSNLMLEIDKEIKLANLDSVEKYTIYQFTSVWNDLMFLKSKQEKREIEAKTKFGKLYDVGGEDAILNEINNKMKKTEPEFFDAAGTYKKGRFIATLSRGKFGFERIQQIKTISEYKMEQTDITDKSPGFMQRFMGGFKK